MCHMQRPGNSHVAVWQALELVPRSEQNLHPFLVQDLHLKAKSKIRNRWASQVICRGGMQCSNEIVTTFLISVQFLRLFISSPSHPALQ